MLTKEQYILRVVLLIFALGGFFLIDLGKILSDSHLPTFSGTILKTTPLPNPPQIIKAVYFTASSAGNQNKVDYLIKLAKETEINAVVMDIKDYSGHIAYDTGLAEVEKYKTARIIIPELDSLIRKLHDEGIYVIARMVIFQDPALASARPDLAVKNGQRLWTDNKGLAWIDPAAKEAWDYNIAIARDAASRGFDEINFDYIRFPTDGNLSAITYPLWDRKVPMRAVISEFFEKLRQGLPDVKLSVDLFGFVMTKKEDFGVGQVVEDAFKYFDFISPMLYPSHYPDTYMGFANPAEHPYEIIKTAMDSGFKRLRDFRQSTENSLARARSINFRPWIQDFNLGANYDSAMVKSEIKAVADAMGEAYGGFMVWNANNKYTEDALYK